MGNYIYKDQNGFIQGKQMADLVRSVFSIMHIAKETKCKAGGIAWIHLKHLTWWNGIY